MLFITGDFSSPLGMLPRHLLLLISYIFFLSFESFFARIIKSRLLIKWETVALAHLKIFMMYLLRFSIFAKFKFLGSFMGFCYCARYMRLDSD